MDDGIIDAVTRQLKSGKEADLFIVEREPYHYVAKVYRERKFRSFKNDAGYREGRQVRNTRAQRALSKGTKFGQELAEKAWHTAEVEALRRLELAGARVPRVLAHHDRVLIMELICDENNQLAPQLAQVPLTAETAWTMYDTIMAQVVLMLLSDLVHGDLSPYNVLVRENQPVIIDMPQVVSAAHNQQAGRLLERDVRAITQHLGLYDPKIRELGKEAWQLWLEYERGTLVPEFRPERGRKRENEVDDLGGLVEFVHSARDEADLEKRAAEGDEDARALLRAADRREAKRARRVAEMRQAEAEALAEAKRHAEEKKRKAERKKAGGGGGRRRKSGRVKPQDKGPEKQGAGKGRRRRRGRGRGGSTEDAPKPETAKPNAGQPQKKRRRRRRGRGGGTQGGDGSGGGGQSAVPNFRKRRS